MTKISDQIVASRDQVKPGEAYNLRPAEGGGNVVAYILRPSEQIPIEREWILLDRLMKRISRAAGILSLNERAIRVLIDFALSLQNEGWRYSLYNVRYHQLKKWSEIVGLPERRISEAFIKLEALGLIRVWRRDSTKNYYAFTEDFGEFLSGVTEELPQTIERQKVDSKKARMFEARKKRKPKSQDESLKSDSADEQDDSVDYGDNFQGESLKSSEVNPCNQAENLSDYKEVESLKSDIAHYIEDSSSINSASNIPHPVVGIQCPHVDNSVPDLTARIMAKRFMAKHLVYETAEMMTGWFTTLIQENGYEKAEAFLSYALSLPDTFPLSRVQHLGILASKFFIAMEKPIYGGAV
jgi:hypothetical protein